jgi:large subunit ribosomal protein L5
MADASYTPRLKAKYEAEIAKAMTEKFGYKNAMEVPKLEKITLNMGVGEASQDKKKVQTAAEEMALIAGQKPVITKAAKTDDEARELLRLFGFPFPREEAAEEQQAAA